MARLNQTCTLSSKQQAIAEAVAGLDVEFLDVCEHRFQGFEIGVDIAEDGDHGDAKVEVWTRFGPPFPGVPGRGSKNANYHFNDSTFTRTPYFFSSAI